MPSGPCSAVRNGRASPAADRGAPAGPSQQPAPCAPDAPPRPRERQGLRRRSPGDRRVWQSGGPAGLCQAAQVLRPVSDGQTGATHAPEPKASRGRQLRPRPGHPAAVEGHAGQGSAPRTRSGPTTRPARTRAPRVPPKAPPMSGAAARVAVLQWPVGYLASFTLPLAVRISQPFRYGIAIEHFVKRWSRPDDRKVIAIDKNFRDQLP